MDYHEDYLNCLPRFTIWMEPRPPRTCAQDTRGVSATRDDEPFGVIAQKTYGHLLTLLEVTHIRSLP